MKHCLASVPIDACDFDAALIAVCCSPPAETSPQPLYTPSTPPLHHHHCHLHLCPTHSTLPPQVAVPSKQSARRPSGLANGLCCHHPAPLCGACTADPHRRCLVHSSHSVEGRRRCWATGHSCISVACLALIDCGGGWPRRCCTSDLDATLHIAPPCNMMPRLTCSTSLQRPAPRAPLPAPPRAHVPTPPLVSAPWLRLPAGGAAGREHPGAAMHGQRQPLASPGADSRPVASHTKVQT